MDDGQGTQDGDCGPWRLGVSVITERRKVPNNRWLTERRQVIGVVAAEAASEAECASQLIHRDETGEQYLWSGFSLVLQRGEAESYYYNLLGLQPSVFVICHSGDGDELVPFLTLASHYEAEAYMEAGASVFAVSMPPEIYHRVEEFVVHHYVPEEKKGRKREQRDEHEG